MKNWGEEKKEEEEGELERHHELEKKGRRLRADLLSGEPFAAATFTNSSLIILHVSW